MSRNRLCSCVISAFLLISVGLGSYASPLDEAPPDQALRYLGIPFLESSALVDRNEIGLTLRAYIMKRLGELEGWQDYASLKPNKAVAINYEKPTANPFVDNLYRHEYMRPYVGYWGGAWEYDTLDEARARALANCQEGNKSCLLFLENDSVLSLEKMIDDYIAARDSFITEQKQKFDHARKTVLLETAIAAAGAASSRQSHGIALRPSRPLRMGYPDHQQDYASACWDGVFYALTEVPDISKSSVLAGLARLRKAGLYGAYRRSVNTVKDFTSHRPGRLMVQIMRFAAKVEFGSARQHEAAEFPENLKSALAGEEIEEVWVEGAVRVTASGIPMIVQEYAKPLAVMTNRHLYEGVEIRMPPENAGCNVSMPFVGKTIDMSVCRGDISCAARVSNTVLLALKAVLHGAPFLASDIENEPFGPGEFGMQRLRLPSEVLGRPNYEQSTYTVETWVGEEKPLSNLYLRQSFMGANARNIDSEAVYLFMKVHHILTASPHKNGVYAEPGENEVARFDAAVQDAVNGAVATACGKLKGKMDGTVCVVREK